MAHTRYTATTGEVVCMDCGMVILEQGPLPELTPVQRAAWFAGAEFPAFTKALFNRAVSCEAASENHVCGVYQ